jgi:mannitol-1-phosphate 5-dehydrogenase
MADRSILIFGAGKIGRSFIGQLFSQAGYKVIFADVDQELVTELNRRKSYPVVIKGAVEETILVKNVRAVYGKDYNAVIDEIARAELIAISVGKNAIELILPLIASGLEQRYIMSPGRPLDIIVAENMRSAKEFILSRLENLLPVGYPIGKLVGGGGNQHW